MSDFVDWLDDELKERGWSRSEAARRGGISASMIDKVVNRTSNPGVDFCKGIARAFGIQELEVIQRAGLVASYPKYNPIVEAAASMLNELSEEDQEDIRAMVRSKWERTQRKKQRRMESKP